MPLKTEHHPSLFQINGDIMLCRYIDLTKLISLLQKKAIFFTRADRVEDPFEGRYPPSQREERKKWYKYMQETQDFFLNMTDADIDKNIIEYEEFLEKYRALTTISCWDCNYSENALMWRSYCNTTTGILIKSSFSRILKSFENTKEDVFVSRVKYLDYGKYLIPDGDTFSPFVHKQHFYRQEEEIRLLHQVDEKAWIHDWDKEESKNGVYIACDIEILIDEIIIAPFAEEWYSNLVNGILEQYNFNKQVKKSNLKWLSNEKI